MLEIKSVHTDPDNFGKYATAVYDCEVLGWHADADDITKILGSTYGVSSSPFSAIHHGKNTRWYQLISNWRQTTRSDVVYAIARSLGFPDAKDPKTIAFIDQFIRVSVLASVPRHGGRPDSHIGTPRLGAKQQLKHSAVSNGVAAR